MDFRTALTFDWPAGPALEPERDDPRSYFANDKSRDGTFVRVRAIRPDDRERLVGMFGRAGEIAAETALHPEVHMGLVATLWIEGIERIVGMASFFVDPWSEPRRAEVALLVLDGWQGRGIGSLLFAHLARVARRSGVDILYAVARYSNPRLLQLLEESGLPLSIERDGAELRVTLILRPAAVHRPTGATRPA